MSSFSLLAVLIATFQFLSVCVSQQNFTIFSFWPNPFSLMNIIVGWMFVLVTLNGNSPWELEFIVAHRCECKWFGFSHVYIWIMLRPFYWNLKLMCLNERIESYTPEFNSWKLYVLKYFPHIKKNTKEKKRIMWPSEKIPY